MSADDTFEISHRREGEAVVVVPVGEIDLVSADGVRSSLLDAARAGRRVVLDLRQVTFMDSSGLRLLVEMQQTAHDHGFHLAVVRGPASLERLFEVTGLDTRLDLHDSLAEAANGGTAGA